MSSITSRLSVLNLSWANRRSRCLAPTIYYPSAVRSFSTTPAHQRLHAKAKLAREHQVVPEYPYGPAKLYKKSNFGLYGGKRVRFGNIVSDGKWIKKTRRRWRPNVQQVDLRSEGLGRVINLKVTTSVLRTIDKVGGLDNYLLGSTSARIKELGMAGWKLRWELMQQPAIVARFKEERLRLGLDLEQMEESAQNTQDSFRLECDVERLSTKSEIEKRRRHTKRKDLWTSATMLGFRKVIKECLEKFEEPNNFVQETAIDNEDISSQEDTSMTRRAALALLEKNLARKYERISQSPQAVCDLRSQVTNQLLTKSM